MRCETCRHTSKGGTEWPCNQCVENGGRYDYWIGRDVPVIHDMGGRLRDRKEIAQLKATVARLVAEVEEIKREVGR